MNIIKERLQELLNRQTQLINSKKERNIRDISSEKINGKQTCYHVFNLKKFTYLQQSNSPEKIFFFEKWKRVDIVGTPASDQLKVGDIEYRICYYIVSKKPQTQKKNRWVFGQFCPMIPQSDYKTLIKKAKNENVIS